MSLSSLNGMFSGWKQKGNMQKHNDSGFFAILRSYLYFGDSPEPNGGNWSFLVEQRRDAIIVFNNSLSALSKSHLNRLQETLRPSWGRAETDGHKNLLYKALNEMLPS